MSSTSAARWFAVPLVLCAAMSVQAAPVVYRSAADFALATRSQGVDNFQTLSNTSRTDSPISRAAGMYAYTAGTTTNEPFGGFFGGGTASDVFLSTNNSDDSITFSGFDSALRGFGGDFFGSDIDGNFTRGAVTLTLTDSTGTTTATVDANGLRDGSFLGFVSDTALVSVVLTAVDAEVFASSDDLTLALAAAPPNGVPEPAALALVLTSLGAAGVASRRRKVSPGSTT